MKSLLTMGLAIAMVQGWSAAVSADEDEHSGVSKLVQKLSPEGLSGKVLQLSRTEAGRRAIGEALDATVAWKTRGYERDLESHLEEYLFTRDAEGFVTVRPERKDELAKVSQEITAATPLFEAFSRRADELAGKISEATELDKQVKAAWRNPEYRHRMFHEISRDGDDEDEGNGQDLSARIDKYFKELLEEKFEQKGAELAVKPAAFADEDGGVPSPEDLEHLLGGGEFAEERAAWVDLSERCTDPAMTDLFASPLAVGALQNLAERHKRSWITQAREKSVEAFARRYLSPSGEKHQWRPERVAKVDELLRRAREIAREIEADERGIDNLPAEPVHPLDRKPITVDVVVVTKDEPRPHLVGRLTGTFEDGGTILLTLRLPASAGDEARDVAVYAAKESLHYVGIEKEGQTPVPGYVAYVWLKADSKEKAETVRFAREK